MTIHENTHFVDVLTLHAGPAHLMPPFAGHGMCSGLRDTAPIAGLRDQLTVPPQP